MDTFEIEGKTLEEIKLYLGSIDRRTVILSHGNVLVVVFPLSEIELKVKS